MIKLWIIGFLCPSSQPSSLIFLLSFSVLDPFERENEDEFDDDCDSQAVDDDVSVDIKLAAVFSINLNIDLSQLIKNYFLSFTHFIQQLTNITHGKGSSVFKEAAIKILNTILNTR